MKPKIQFKFKSSAPLVIKAGEDAAEKIGKRFGYFVMTTARRSLKKARNNEPSPPGSPPKSRDGALKRFLLFAWDPETRSVVIGPSLLPGKQDAPEALEKGKTTTRRVFIGRGRLGRKTVRYEPRPFMGPALQQRLPELPGLWKNAIRE